VANVLMGSVFPLLSVVLLARMMPVVLETVTGVFQENVPLMPCVERTVLWILNVIPRLVRFARMENVRFLKYCNFSLKKKIFFL